VRTSCGITVDDIHRLSSGVVVLRFFVAQLGDTQDLFDEGVTNRLVKKALAQDIEIGKQLIVLVRLFGESTQEVGSEDVGGQAFAVGVAEVVSDLGILIRQFDDACLAFSPLFLQSCLEEVGSA
jgi:hypothetical protein